jgi:hypothetical protein
MGLTVTFHNPAYPDGYAFGIEGLGVLNNGEASEISEEQEQAFANATGATIAEAFENNEFATVEGDPTVSGPEEPTGTQPAAEPEEGEGEETAPEEGAEETEGESEGEPE